MRTVPIVGTTGDVRSVALSRGLGSFPQPVDSIATVTTVTADATAHTKGAWSQIIASTPAAGSWILVQIASTSASNTNTDSLVDIGIGAAASEVVVVANLPAGGAGANTPLTAWIPLNVPKGSRISARMQSVVTAGKTATVSVVVLSDVLNRGPAKVDTYGADTAASNGVAMPTDNTYVEVTSATTQAYRALIMLPCSEGSAATSWAAETTVYTLAIGASGSEVALSTAQVSSTTSESLYTTAASGGSPIVGHLPRGTRIAVKQSVGRNYRGVIVLGVPYS